MSNARTIFLDTNCFLHYSQLADIDFCALAGAANVKLIVCLQVIHELDVKKSDSRLATRAERAIRDIHKYRQKDTSIRPGVTLEVYNRAIRLADFPDTLSSDSQDDRIVHLVKQYQQQYPEETVCVMTEDAGMSLRCEAHSILLIAPTKSQRLPNPQSDIEKKYREAIAEREAGKARAPALAVSVYPGCPSDEVNLEDLGHGPVHVQLHRRSMQALDIDSQLAQERDELLADLPLPPQRLPGMTVDQHERFAAVLGFSTQRINDYKGKVEAHLQLLRVWFADHEKMLDASRRRVSIVVRIGNSGGSPADDVEVALTFPENICSVECENSCVGAVPTGSARPKPPERPVSAINKIGRVDPNMFYGMFDYRRGLEALRPRDDDPTEHAFMSKGLCSIQLCHPRLLQHKHFIWCVRLGFPTWEAISPFEISAVLTSASTPDRREWRIPILPTIVDISSS